MFYNTKKKTAVSSYGGNMVTGTWECHHPRTKKGRCPHTHWWVEDTDLCPIDVIRMNKSKSTLDYWTEVV